LVAMLTVTGADVIMVLKAALVTLVEILQVPFSANSLIRKTGVQIPWVVGVPEK
jgi:hypothetical protein